MPERTSSRSRKGKRQGERGAVSVEFALVMPLVVLVLIGGIHFGGVLMTRHELTEATNYATRSAAIARDGNAGRIRNLIMSRMGPNSGCSNILVNSTTATNAMGVTHLRVTARCTLAPSWGSGFLGGVVGPSSLSVSVAMPF
jgi:Flp pilus assembly protein TadG